VQFFYYTNHAARHCWLKYRWGLRCVDIRIQDTINIALLQTAKLTTLVE